MALGHTARFTHGSLRGHFLLSLGAVALLRLLACPLSTFAHTILGAFLTLCGAAALLAGGAFASLALAGAGAGAGTTRRAGAGLRVHVQRRCGGRWGELA